jgi:transposase
VANELEDAGVPADQTDIMFSDEAAFGLMDDPKMCWVKGERPTVPCQTVREKTYAYAAVNPFNGDMTSLILPYTNTKVMGIFLEEVSIRQADRFTLLFMDQAGWHTAKDLEIPPNIRLAYLPPYSPELNPTEHIWDELREKYFHNVTFDSLSSLEDRLEIGLNELEQNTRLMQSMIGFDWIVSVK